MSIKPQRSRMRGLQIESLESRLALASNPIVLDVNIDSTQWSSYFTYNLESNNWGDGGYSVMNPYSPSKSPWSNVDQLHIRFDQDVNVDAWDLTLTGVNTGTYEFADFSYDSNTATATWTLDAPLAADVLHLDLNGDGLDPVANSHGPLQGGDFELEFSSVPGDVDNTDTVTSVDAQLVQDTLGQGVGSYNYGANLDIDGSGNITAADVSLAQGFIGDSLPTGAPLGISRDAPSSSGIPDVQVNEDAANYIIALDAVFADEEDPVTDLTYSVVDNTSPNLFAAVSIDQSSGELTMDFGADQFGSGGLTIRATDSDGMFIDVPFQVNVNPVNDAPSFEDVVELYDWQYDRWQISGRVIDVDGNLLSPNTVVSVVGMSIVADIEDDGAFSLWLPIGFAGSFVTISYTDELGLTVQEVVQLNVI